MGDFKIEINAAGPHGCDREAKQGEPLSRACNRMDCPDCLARDLVRKFKAQGMMIHNAEFTNWPGQVSEVKDDLKTGVRIKGSFDR